MKLTNLRKQKFHRGDLVKVADDLGPSMSHFESGCVAIVLYSYADRYGSDNTDSFALLLLSPKRGINFSAWYHPAQLELIIKNFVAGLEGALTLGGF